MTKFLNLSNDSTFESNSPYIAVSQKAIKGAMDLKADKSDTYTKSQVYTKTEVDTIAENIVIEGGGVTPQDLEPKVNRTELADVAFSGSYTDLTNTPTIPTTVAQLTDASNYVLSSSLANIATSGSWNDLSSTPTSISGYGITDAYTKTEIDTKMTSAMHYKGSVAAVADLPSTGNAVGDFYNVTATGENYAWTGTEWDVTGSIVDLQSITNAEIDTVVAS